MNRSARVSVVLVAVLSVVGFGCREAPRGVALQNYQGKQLDPPDLSLLDPMRRTWYAPETSPQRRVEIAQQLTRKGMTPPEVTKVLGTPTRRALASGYAFKGADDPAPRRYLRETWEYWFGEWIICLQFDAPITNWASDLTPHVDTWPLEEIYCLPTNAVRRPKPGEWECLGPWPPEPHSNWLPGTLWFRLNEVPATNLPARTGRGQQP